MYIKEFTLKNIRGIKDLHVTFDDPAGWHVFIGDNGSGKTTVMRALALSLVGPEEGLSLHPNYSSWINSDAIEADIFMDVLLHDEDKHTGRARRKSTPVHSKITIKEGSDSIGNRSRLSVSATDDAKRHQWSDAQGYFSAGFGPFRRFTGGEKDREKIFYSNPKAAAHLTIFGEQVALTESVAWLQKLKYKDYEGDGEAKYLIANFKRFINESGLLPHETKIVEIKSSGVFMRDGADNTVELTDMSDGFRSILSMTFELIRQLVLLYGAKPVLAPIAGGDIRILQHGVVLIDEVDVHLHPTWQAEIGQWFLEKFPHIQFIVTTHSPIICRAAERGSIWRLTAPGSDQDGYRVVGTALKRLVFGNILDAFGTQLFGQDTTSSDSSTELREEYARLNQQSVRGLINEEGRERLAEIQAILPTEAFTE
jgi:predicted ATPase